MSDGIAPAIDKVGEPEPKAPEAEANAPTMQTAAHTTEDSKSDEKKSEDQKPEEQKPVEKTTEEKELGIGAKIGHILPKPVEVTSVPQTPLNDRTPAGGTPRPELRIDEEDKENTKEEAQVILGKMEDDSTAKDEESSGKPAEPETNGADENIEMEDAPAPEVSGETAKRKLDEEPAANGNASKEEDNGSDERSEKKAKVENDPAPTSAESATNGKVGRPKKDKKAAPTVGRTARKTRSQGPVEALGV